MQHHRYAGCTSQRRVQLGGALVAQRNLVLADTVEQRAARGENVAGESALSCIFGGDHLADPAAQIFDAAPHQRRGRDHVEVTRSVLGNQRAQVIADLPHGRGIRDSVHLVEHHDHHALVVLQRGQVVLMQACVGILLRIGHPDEDV